MLFQIMFDLIQDSCDSIHDFTEEMHGFIVSLI